MLLHVLNRQGELLTVIHNDAELGGITELRLTEDIAEIGTLEFTVKADTDGVEHITDKAYILLKNRADVWKLFVVKDITDSHGHTIEKRVYCEDILTELGEFNTGKNYNGVTMTPTSIATEVLSGTGYELGEVNMSFSTVALEQDTRYISKLSTLQALAGIGSVRLFLEVQVSGQSVSKKIIHLKESNNSNGKRFEFDSDLTSIERGVDATAVKTAVLALGKQKEQSQEDKDAGKPVEYVTFTDIVWNKGGSIPLNKPAGQDYLEDPEATAKYGIKTADGSVKPKLVVVEFSQIEDPEELLWATWAYLDKLSKPKTTFTFTANDLSQQLGADIGELPVQAGDICYVIDDSVNPPIVEEVIVRRLEGDPSDPASMTIEIGNPKDTLVDETMSEQVNTAINNNGTINAIFGDLKAVNAEITYLKANSIDVEELNAIRANIKVLNADVATINELVAGNITSDNIHSSGITSDKLVIANGFIKDAMIDTVNAGKIQAGTVNTNKVHIESENGGIVIADSTQQFKDRNGNVRIQMGQDANGEFTFAIFDTTGNGVLFDHTGIKEGAIANGIIKNDMIGTGEIGGEKINISSMISAVNNGTSTIKGSKVYLDTSNQTLEVGFNTLKTTSDKHTETIESNTTQLNLQSGKIDTLISDTTIVKDGQSLKLKDEYSKLEQTVGGISTTVGRHESTITELGKEVSTAKTAIQQNADAIKLSATKTEVTETVNTAIATTVKSVDVMYALSTSTTTAPTSGWQTTAPQWTTGKYMWSKTVTTFVAGNITESAPTCIAGAQGQQGQAGANGATGATGATGQGVESITEEYYLSTSKDTQTGGSWVTTPPTWATGMYMWTRSKIVYKNPTATAYTTPVCDSSWEAVNGVQVGGRNLQEKGDLSVIATTVHSNDGYVVEYTTTSLNQGIKTANSYDLIPNATYTLSYKLTKISGNIINVGGHSRHTHSAFYVNGVKVDANYHNGYACTLSDNQTISVSTTFVANSSTTGFERLVGIEVNRYTNGNPQTARIRVEQIKLEKGNKATDWTPAPEDVSQEITSKVDQAKADIKVTTDGISSSVSKLETTTTTLDGKVNNQETRLASAEQKITPSAIKTTVEQQVNANGSTVLASKSDVAQSVTDVTFSFTQTGNLNYVYNGSFQNGTTNWSNYGTPVRFTANTSNFGYGNCATIEVNSSNQGAQQTVSGLSVGKTYTVSCYAQASTGSCCLQVVNSGVYTNRYTSSTGAYVKLEIVFKATATSVVVQLGRGSGGSNGLYYFTAVQLQEGNIATAWKPHSSEIYNASTVINGSGLTVNNGALTVKNKSGTTVLSGDSNGNLTLTGTLTGSTITGGTINGTAINSTNIKCKRELTLSYDSIYPPQVGFTTSSGTYLGYIFGMGTGASSDTNGLVVASTGSHIDFRTRTNQYSPLTLINNEAFISGKLQDNRLTTGNKQLMNVGSNTIYVGNPVTPVAIESTNTRFSMKNGQITLSSDGTYGTINPSTSYLELYKGARVRGTFWTYWDGTNVRGFETTRGSGYTRMACSDTSGGIRIECKTSSTTESGSYVLDGTGIRPGTNGNKHCGHSSFRWVDVWCTRGAFNGSDSKLKENIRPLPIGNTKMVLSDDYVSATSFYDYVKGAKCYTFNYKRTVETTVGIMADDIPDNIFNVIGVWSKTEEEYADELAKQSEYSAILANLPNTLIEGEENTDNTIVEGTELTRRELEREVEKEVEPPVRLINAPAQTAMLQSVLSQSLQKIDVLESKVCELEQENAELKARLKVIEDKLGL